MLTFKPLKPIHVTMCIFKESCLKQTPLEMTQFLKMVALRLFLETSFQRQVLALGHALRSLGKKTPLKIIFSSMPSFDMFFTISFLVFVIRP